MKMKSKKKVKLVIRFDPEARREYLTGFSKRKRLRKARAKIDKEKLQLKQRKKLQVEKKEELKEKMNRYGLGEEKADDVDQSAAVPTLQDDHPNHVVVINTNPDFGLSLSAMVDDDSEPVNVSNCHKSNQQRHVKNLS